ncbi:MAG TPA: EF-hand domain-containing protein [Caulobacteraceae bacterium]|jgi:Ca2+-binding EF-hand superfamily protein|nr:EF-hand domain-containing protein [Caulobacteraceae bacterium]
MQLKMLMVVAALSLAASQAGAAGVAGGRLNPDANGDGKVSADEFQAAMSQRLMAADINGDGKVSKAEFEAIAAARPGGGGRATMFWSRLDADGDGFLSKAEIAKLSERRFARLDANHDGWLSAEELQAMRLARQGRAGGQ